MTVITAKPNVVASDIGGDWALLDLDSSVYYTLNPTGAHVWNVLSEGATIENLYDSVIAAFDVDMETCKTDVQALINQLRDADLISIAPSSDGRE